jgi:hypothetical protein
MRSFLSIQFLILVICGTLSVPASAATVLIEASQDNTLYETDDGSLSNGKGDYIFAGRTSNSELRRGLIAFKNLSAIPPGATIESVKLHLWMSKTISDPTTIQVFRLISDWGEGSSVASGQEGGGGTRQTGDATWIHTFYNTSNWATPGGDYAGTASAQLNVDALGAYEFGSNSSMVSDLQDWIENPAGNFGYILIAGESTASARRFNSRESISEQRRPMLEVEYSGGTLSDYSGPWFDPDLDGEGYLVFNTPVGWLVYYFGYSASGDRLWLVSDIVEVGEPVLGQDYEFSMLVGTPGSFEMPTPSANLEIWGTLWINLTNCAAGVFTMDGGDGMKVSNVQKIVGIEGVSCGAQ